jgi:hypothetical protein
VAGANVMPVVFHLSSPYSQLTSIFLLLLVGAACRVVSVIAPWWLLSVSRARGYPRT